jgi:PAS domain S-box-containing protein
MKSQLALHQTSVERGRLAPLLRLLAVAVAFATLSLMGLVMVPANQPAAEVLRGTGIGMGILLVFGRSLWPGIFVGAAFSKLVMELAAADKLPPEVLVATVFLFAAGAALQTLLGATLIRRFAGVPIRLDTVRRIVLVCVMAGPVSCLVLPTLGTIEALSIGNLHPGNMPQYWLVWWIGDIIGVFVALPVLVLGPWNREPFAYWKDTPLPRFTSQALIYLTLSLIVTFGTWSVINTINSRNDRAQFETLADDAKKALLRRLETYGFGLAGVAGLFNSSDTVTLAEMQRFVSDLNLADHLPGVSGMGFIEPATPAAAQAAVAQAKAEGSIGVSIAEPAPDQTFVVRFVEPDRVNPSGLTQNMAFEKGVYLAAVAARDSGETTIARNMQSAQGAGFVLLKPLYANVPTLQTVEARQAAFRGWIYAPFTASGLLDRLTASQDANLGLTVYQGAAADASTQVYSNQTGRSSDFLPRFRLIDPIPIYDNTWTVVWESTPALEASLRQAGPAVLLYAGLAFTLLLGVFLLTLSRREESIRQTVARRTRELAAQVDENRSIIETAVANIALLDGNGKIMAANDAMQRLFGYERADLIGIDFSTLLHGQLADYFARGHGEVGSVGDRGEFTTTTKAGVPLVVDVQINTWATGDGQLRHTVIMVNITDKRKVEDELRHTQHRLDIALTGAKIGVFDLDLRTGTSVVSNTWKLLLGFDPEQTNDAQSEWRNRVHPLDFPITEAADRACIEGRAERSISEYRLLTANGTWRWMRSDAVGLDRDENGRARRLIGVLTDITDLVQGKEDLEASEDRFRSAIEHAPIGMALVDLWGRVTMVNSAMAEMFGRSETQMLARRILSLAAREDRSRLIAGVRSLLSGRQRNFRAEIRCTRPDQGVIWGLAGIAIVRNSRGEALNFVVEVQDITEQKRVDDLKSQFVSTVSHELRTPLTSINGSLGLVLNVMSGDMPDRAVRMLSIAQKNCDRLILLVNDILDMEKISSGQMQFKLAMNDLSSLVQKSVIDTQPFAQKYGVTFAIQGTPAPSLSMVDENRFHQVMANLLSNAAKFSMQGGTVEIDMGLRHNMHRISVTDHGRGIPPEFRDRLFKPFSQVDSSASREKEGTGLGLAIARQIIEGMHGRIGFVSTPGVGTTFWIELPAAPNKSVEDENKSASPNAIVANRKPRILHFEHDHDFSEVFRMAFDDSAEVVNADTQDRVKVLLLVRSFDLVVLDGELTDQEGSALITEILRLSPGLPIVALTAKDREFSDSRIWHTFVKSRAAMPEIVALCLTRALANLPN